MTALRDRHRRHPARSPLCVAGQDDVRSHPLRDGSECPSETRAAHLLCPFPDDDNGAGHPARLVPRTQSRDHSVELALVVIGTTSNQRAPDQSRAESWRCPARSRWLHVVVPIDHHHRRTWGSSGAAHDHVSTARGQPRRRGSCAPQVVFKEPGRASHVAFVERHATHRRYRQPVSQFTQPRGHRRAGPCQCRPDNLALGGPSGTGPDGGRRVARQPGHGQSRPVRTGGRIPDLPPR